MRWVYLAAPGTAASSVFGTFAACCVWAALAAATDRGRGIGSWTASMSNGLQFADQFQA